MRLTAAQAMIALYRYDFFWPFGTKKKRVIKKRLSTRLFARRVKGMACGVSVVC